MNAFAAAYKAWRDCSFPPGSADDAIDELHADLALADHWVVESVVPYVERGIYKPAHVDVLTELSQLRERAERLLPVASAGDAQIVLAYREYVDLLSEVSESFLALHAQG